MRLLPRTLFGRLALLLTVLLAAAQLISAAAHFYDRNQLLFQTSGLNSAERVAGMVRLLDLLPPEGRTRAARDLDVPPLRVTLQPVVIPPGEDTSPTAHHLLGLLRQQLGPTYPVRLAVREPSVDDDYAALRPPSGMPPWMATMHRRMGAAFAPRLARASYLVQVTLRDGGQVTFDYSLPADLFAWRWRLVASLLILLVSAVLIAYIAVRLMTRPLSTLAHAADELGRDIRHEPLSEAGPVEVSLAARAFNRMQQRLLRYIDDRARVLAAVSHDLKTPITRLRLRAEMLNDETLREKIQRDLDEMETMVTDTLQFLKGMESGEPLQPVDLQALLESMQADAEEAGQRFTIEGGATAPYRGRPLAIKRCLTNLIGNAFQYGKQVTVQVADTPEELRIRVQDDGPGIPGELLERVFEPFFRADPSRTRSSGGHGLGLAIARNIARAHGGDVTLSNRPEGGLAALLILAR